MYSEHIIAELLRLVDSTYVSGGELDSHLSRLTVQIGKVIGPTVGSNPSDIALTWWVSQKGVECPIGTRGAIHLLPDSRVAMSLGSDRGYIETAGDHLAIVQNPETNRYIRAYKLPGVAYGGLL